MTVKATIKVADSPPIKRCPSLNCFVFIFVGKQQQGPPADLQAKELPGIAKEIANIWKEVALRTGKFDQNEVTNIKISRLGEDESSKALTMLMWYNERDGTRATLAKAIGKDKDKVSKKVLEGYFTHEDDVDIN